MKLFSAIAIAVMGLAASGAAQQPTPAPAKPAPAADTASVVQLDRIVAVVGDQVITQYDLQERMLAAQQQPGFKPPQTEDEFQKMARDVLNQLIDEEILVQHAARLKVTVEDRDLTATADKQMQEIRSRFTSDGEFRTELAKAGLGSPEEYRRFLMDQLRRSELQRRAIQKMREDGKIPPVNVTEAEVEDAFNRTRANLPRRPATVTFRQIVIAPHASAAAKEKARAKAESLLAEIKAGADFERVAKRESADSGSREQGGDLGWNRRGVMVPEFERWMFGLRPGEMSPVVETVHGFHIIRVDRVQPGEVKSRHILVQPKIDSLDVQRALLQGDTVAQQWKAGAVFDSLAKKYHDYASGEETSILTPVSRDSMLPPTYKAAFEGKKANDIVGPFAIAGVQGKPKFVVAQLLSVDEGGEYKLADLRDRVRQQLSDEGSFRRVLDGLRKETYVSIRLDDAMKATAPRGPQSP